MDVKAIADALALRYSSTNVTPPSGFKNITTSTAQPPNNIPSTPYVIVWTTEGEVTLTSSTASHVMTWPVTFYVERWTSDEDGERLNTILKEGGPDALLREFQKGRTRAGYVVSPAFSREPSWRVAMATAVDTPRGRVVRLLTDRPIQFAEAYSQSRSLDYEFAAFEFTLDRKGNGQGIAVPAARLVQAEDGQVTVETLPYTTGPEKLIGVRTWGSEKKGN
jgi:hypothetical protein